MCTISDELPNVRTIYCNEAKIPSFDMCLVIKYAQGEVEYSGLMKVEGFESILEGSLIASGEVKQGSRVSVTLTRL